MEATDGRLGIFRARVTQDGEALARDGHPHYGMNHLSEVNRSEGERNLYEIQFADGLWMLVREDDLVVSIVDKGA